MNNPIASYLLLFYGLFLITCGIVAVIFIGLKAKTALISGGSSGLISILIAYLISQKISMAPIAGIVISGALLIVFSWRSTKTLFSIFEMIPLSNPDLKGKGIAFLIISTMAIVSLFIFGAQIISLFYYCQV